MSVFIAHLPTDTALRRTLISYPRTTSVDIFLHIDELRFLHTVTESEDTPKRMFLSMGLRKTVQGMFPHKRQSECKRSNRWDST